ncbi:integrase core domain-containing protein [Tessaracoccus sp.]|uniref:integrase core domain-containing protein n=1 Tax=Tessaracoccus sp. TaxID=1971211 RepID=UPI00261A5513|nr:integrase core domain-containing protein [Tessaracoccus sp.]
MIQPARTRTFKTGSWLAISDAERLLHAQVVIGDWKDEYNHHRRHSSLGYLPPAEYARQCTHQIETDDSHTVRTE